MMEKIPDREPDAVYDFFEQEGYFPNVSKKLIARSNVYRAEGLNVITDVDGNVTAVFGRQLPSAPST